MKRKTHCQWKRNSEKKQSFQICTSRGVPSIDHITAFNHLDTPHWQSIFGGSPSVPVFSTPPELQFLRKSVKTLKNNKSTVKKKNTARRTLCTSGTTIIVKSLEMSNKIRRGGWWCGNARGAHSRHAREPFDWRHPGKSRDHRSHVEACKVTPRERAGGSL